MTDQVLMPKSVASLLMINDVTLSHELMINGIDDKWKISGIVSPSKATNSEFHHALPGPVLGLDC